MTRTTNSFETTVEVCCHRVSGRYSDFDHELTEELEKILTAEVESRAQECIVQGYHSGELNCCHYDGKTEEEIRGWWDIERD